MNLGLPMDEVERRTEAALNPENVARLEQTLQPGEENYPMTMEQFARWRKTIG